jgi:hypothetical protein
MRQLLLLGQIIDPLAVRPNRIDPMFESLIENAAR